ncbi:MAG TPA: glycosyltransferase family 2 protein, partial [Bacteroidia bacterium]|nr:glycosyltransferase family 2 protein [Bacteroidia bacterium]
MRTSLLKILPAVAPEKTGWPWLEETSVCEFNFDINYPKITIITPSFNQGDFIEETIRSVLLQNYPNLEYFIMDGGSTDESVDIIKKYEPFITYFESKKDNGQSHAINKGLAKTTGDIVTWLNSDDYYNAGTLFEIANEFIQQVNCNCVIGKSHVFGDGKSYIAKSPLFESVEKTIGFGRIVQPAMFFKTNLYNQIG